MLLCRPGNYVTTGGITNVCWEKSLEYIRVDYDCHVYYFCWDLSGGVYGCDVCQVGCEVLDGGDENETERKLATISDTPRDKSEWI